ncbi:MAG: UDP-N-acetylglucosamine 2-epimerase (non-hydrolyzing) [Deltaproteobacteria bacterium]|nr:UDP-N-acetylglucosamine 2-epimerase (non-hydrolyzing) [Deltaproteobacteria bacterium]MBW2447750.1 UDP-N-acetylglucosamine 2-epimerase (non-hydrolyzing) [Deltaproteobacteria bacterium]
MTARPKIRLVVVAGARPNFMKIAPLVRELAARGCFETCLVHTGQHYDAAMSDSFFRDLGIPEPDLNLGVGSGSHGAMTAQVLAEMETVLTERKPDALIVVGDVNSTVAASLAAAKLCIPVAHVEAGLRSFDRTMPEEINRLVTDVISDWLFTSEPSGGENLRREGTAEEKIHFVGNVMIDTLQANLSRARELDTLGRLGLEAGGYAALTLHRPSNVDERETLVALFDVLEEIQREIPIVFPVHPRTAAAIERLLGGREPKLRMIEPLGYLDFLRLMSEARFVLTDSGGIQEETTVLGIPCLTMRENTERPITIHEGTNTLVGSDPATIRAEVRKILDGEAPEGRIPEGWDGRAASRIVDVLERDLG